MATGQSSLASRLSSFTLAGRQRDNPAVICAPGTSPPASTELPACPGVPCAAPPQGGGSSGPLCPFHQRPEGRGGQELCQDPGLMKGPWAPCKKWPVNWEGGHLPLWLQGWLDRSCPHAGLSPAPLLHGSSQGTRRE